MYKTQSPPFLFTGKENKESFSIEEVVGVCRSIFLCKMKRAMIRQAEDPEKKGERKMSAQFMDRLLQITDSNYFEAIYVQKNLTRSFYHYTVQILKSSSPVQQREKFSDIYGKLD